MRRSRTNSTLTRPSTVRIPRASVTIEERRAIFGVCDELIGHAGRTTLLMALRGSRAERVRQFPVETARGYGYFAGQPEAEVMAKIDSLIATGLIRLEYRDGFPLLGYTEQGLAEAVAIAAKEWLDLVAVRVGAVAAGGQLELPFLPAVMPNRSLDTMMHLVDGVRRTATPGWLPLLRAWHAMETRRMRASLAPIIAELVAPTSGGPNEDGR